MFMNPIVSARVAISRVMAAAVMSSLIAPAASASSWAICRDDIESNTPDERYALLAGGAEVLDKYTQLVWQRCVVGERYNPERNTCDGDEQAMTWAEAMALQDDTWRVPNLKEAYSLLSYNCHFPSLNHNIFSQAVSNNVSATWTSTPYIRKESERYVMDYFNVKFRADDRKEIVRLVRDNR